MSTRSLDDYVGRVTSRWRDKPDYLAMLQLILQPFVDVQNLQAQLATFYYDLDAAVGPQLDAVGVRIGLSREVSTPLPTLYFSLDDPLRGLDQGVLYNAVYGNQYGITALDDQTYRQMLRAKAIANAWDGTLLGVQAIVAAMFSSAAVGLNVEALTAIGTYIVIQDDSSNAYPNLYFSLDDDTAGLDQGLAYDVGDPINNVSVVDVGLTVGVSGVLPPLYLLFLLEQQLIPFKPCGVPLTTTFTSVSGAPLFGLDADNDYVGGLDRGTVGVDAEYIVNAPPASVYPATAGAN